MLRWVLGACLAASAWGQSVNEVWPEADVYVTLTPQTRFLYTLRDDVGLSDGSNSIADGFDLEYFVPRFRPVFFRELIKINDARIQRIVLDAGERLVTTVNAHPSIFEKRTLVQASLRWAVPFGALFTSRNRVEFRFVNGVSSRRGREQLSLEKDIRLKRYALTEYVSGEAFYDSTTDSVDRFRVIAGVVLPVAKKTTLEPYFMRQDSWQSHPGVVQAMGLRLSLFLRKRTESAEGARRTAATD
jgi:Protein of unknown function (DUF2490)